MFRIAVLLTLMTGVASAPWAQSIDTVTLGSCNDAGTHSVVFNASKFANGVYFYRLTAPGVNIVRKMLLVK